MKAILIDVNEDKVKLVDMVEECTVFITIMYQVKFC